MSFENFTGTMGSGGMNGMDYGTGMNGTEGGTMEGGDNNDEYWNALIDGGSPVVFMEVTDVVQVFWGLLVGLVLEQVVGVLERRFCEVARDVRYINEVRAFVTLTHHQSKPGFSFLLSLPSFVPLPHHLLPDHRRPILLTICPNTQANPLVRRHVSKARYALPGKRRDPIAPQSKSSSTISTRLIRRKTQTFF